MSLARRALSAVLALLLIPSLAVAAAVARPATAAARASTAHTSRLEARRVDRVPTPKLHWYACNDYPGAQCATVRVPRDYDHPKGDRVQLAVVRMPALDQRHKIGSLFVNPGGPGASATELAGYAPYLFGRALLRRFDVIGIDPRGTNYSAQVRCFRDARRQQPTMIKLSVPFPVTGAEVSRFSAGSVALGKACSHHGKPLTGAVSTAEDARDMDVVRRAVGDPKLTYLGFSYGTYLGQVYADLFPDRVRSMVLDGVVDPRAWAGTSSNRTVPQTLRVPSAQASYRALRELLRRCDQADRRRCSFASGNSVAKFGRLADRLKKRPIRIDDPYLGAFTIDYAMLISDVLSGLYDPDGYREITAELTALWELTSLPTSSLTSSLGTVSSLRRGLATAHHALARRVSDGRLGFPYDNSLEAYWSVMCTDSVNPRRVSAWPAAVRRAGGSGKYFAELWGWSSAPCATSSWTVRDEDRYRGPFNRRTAGPVLVVGNYWDPATNYRSARAVAGLLPHSRLLLSDSWGHTAYGTSSCATRAVNAALLRTELPVKGTRCVGNDQPYQRSAGGSLSRRRELIDTTSPGTQAALDLLRGTPGVL